MSTVRVPDHLRPQIDAARADPRRRFGRYLVLAELGKGGMGVVYKAWDDSLGRLVALKLVLGDDGQADTRERFQREAEAVARIRHPNVVGVHEVGELVGKRFIAMDFIDGVSLSERLSPKREGVKKIAWTKALEVVRDVARAIQFAHEQGVIHRDLKPQNVMVDAREHPYVMDFGLAKLRGDRTKLTKSGAGLGTPAYMPPEQAEGGAVDERADVYSLGATLYHVLAGRPPFEGESELNVITALLTKDPVPPSAINARATGDLETICLRCLEKEPAARYPSAGALADELDRFFAGEPIEARPIGTVSRLFRRARRNPVGTGLVFLALASLAAGGAFGVQQWRVARAVQAAADEERRTNELANEEQVIALLAQRAESSVAAGRFRDAARYAWIARLRANALATKGKLRPELDLAANVALATARWGPWSAPRELDSAKDVTAAAVSPRDALLAIGTRSGALELWDLRPAGGRPQRVEVGKEVTALAWRPDGSSVTIATGDGSVQSWNVPDGSAGDLHVPQGVRVGALGWDPSGERLLVGSDDGKLRLVAGGRVHDLPFHHAPGSEVLSLAWRSDGQAFATGGNDQRVWLVDLSGGKMKPQLLPHQQDGAIWALAFSHDAQPEADGLIASGSYDRTIVVWTRDGTQRVAFLVEHEDTVTALSWSESPLISASADRTIRAWPLDRDGSSVVIDTNTSTATRWIGRTPDKRIVALAPGERARVYDAWSGPETVVNSFKRIRCVAWNRKGNQLAVGGDDKTVQVWDDPPAPLRRPARTLVLDPPLRRLRSYVTALAWFDDDRRIAEVDYERELRTWDVAAGRAEEPQPDATVLAVSRDRKLVAIADHGHGRPQSPGAVRVRGEDGTWRTVLANACVETLAFDPTGKRLAIARSDGQLVIVDLVTGEKTTHQATEGTPSGQALAFTSDGRWLAAGVHNVTFHEIGGSRVITTGEDARIVHAIAFHPTAAVLAVSSTGGTIRLLYVGGLDEGKKPRPIARLRGHRADVLGLAWSDDGNRLASVSQDGTARTWPLGEAFTRSSEKPPADIAALVEAPFDPLDSR